MEQNTSNTDTTGKLENKSIQSPISYLGQLGGYRHNGGRKKGSKNKKTREQQLVSNEISERARSHAHRLFHAKMHLAEGLVHMFKIVERKGKPDQHVLITDVEEIMRVLDARAVSLKKSINDIEGLTDMQRAQVDFIIKNSLGLYVDSQYYFIAAQDPDNRAIEDLWDRGLGPVQRKVDLTTKDKPLPQPLLFALNNDHVLNNDGTKENIPPKETN